MGARTGSRICYCITVAVGAEVEPLAEPSPADGEVRSGGEVGLPA